MVDFQHQRCHLIVEQNKNTFLQEYLRFFSFLVQLLVVVCCDEVIAYGGDCHIEEEGSGY